MSLVVDASVAALWVLDQQGSARAAALRAENGLIAPSLIAAEVASAVWKAMRRGDFSGTDALVAIETAILPFEFLVPTQDLRVHALALAIDLDHPVYDCFYLALAERERCEIVTADARLATTAKKLKRLVVRPL